MRWYGFQAILLLFYLLTPLSAQVSKPLTTRYLECVRNANGVPVASRTERTPVFTAKDNARAYGVVVAQYDSGACTNISSVFIADPQRPFKLVFKQLAEPLPDGTVYDGNGIQAIRWSPSGKRLLLEVSQWSWGTDTGLDTKYMLLHRDGNALRQIMPEEAIWKRFTTPCQMSVASTGWTDDSHLEFELAPSQSYDVEGAPDPEPPCVEHTTKFTFDVVAQTLQP